MYAYFSVFHYFSHKISKLVPNSSGNALIRSLLDAILWSIPVIANCNFVREQFQLKLDINSMICGIN